MFKAYFSGIIAMSGSPVSKFAIDEKPMKSSEAIATAYNCPVNETVKMVVCLRALPTERIVEHDNQQEASGKQAQDFVTDLSSLLNSGPVVEGQNDLRFV